MGILKLGGLASGLDTEALIKQLLAVERRPVGLLEQRKEKLTTEANAWRDLNSRLLNLQSRLADLKNLSSSTWSAKKVSVSNSSVLSAKVDTTAVPGTYAVNVVSLAERTSWKSGLSVADANADLGFSGTITVSGGPGNTKTFDVLATDSLNEIASTINSRSDLGFTASVLQVSPGDYRLVLNGQTGQANDFSLTDSVGTAAASLQIDSTLGTKVTVAANSVIEVNSIQIESATNTVTAAIPGTTLSLLATGNSTITVADDPQKAVDAVKALVDQYNSVMDFIGQQTKYDSKTKKTGTLFGESVIQSISSNLSSKLQDMVPSLAADMNMLSQAGVSTEKYVAGQGASRKLVFDQAKFTAALEKDPTAVQELFTLDNGSNKGVAVRLEEWLKGYTKTGGAVLGQASSRDSEVKHVNDRITYFDEVVLPLKERRLRDQFVNLEKSLAMFQNQGQWLSSQLSSLFPKQQG